MTYVDPMVEAVARASAIVERPVATITKEEWQHLGQTTEYYRDFGVPRELPDLPSLAKVLEHQQRYPNRDTELKAAIYFDARRVLKVSPEERDSQLADLMSQRAESLSRDQLIRISALLKVGAETGIPEYPYPGRSFGNEVRMVLEGLQDASGLQPYFDRRVIELMTAGERDAALNGLMSKHSSELTDDDWWKLASLLDMYSEIERKWKLPDIQPLLDKALLIPNRSAPAGGYTEDVQRYFDVWQRSQGDRFWNELDATRERVLAGSTAKADSDFLITAWSRLAMKVGEAAPEATRDMANAVLKIPMTNGLITADVHRAALVSLKESLGPQTSPLAEQIRRDTVQLIEDTLADPRNMTEFANLGQIRSNLEFMDLAAGDSPDPVSW